MSKADRYMKQARALQRQGEEVGFRKNEKYIQPPENNVNLAEETKEEVSE